MVDGFGTELIIVRSANSTCIGPAVLPQQWQKGHKTPGNLTQDSQLLPFPVVALLLLERTPPPASDMDIDTSIVPFPVPPLI